MSQQVPVEAAVPQLATYDNDGSLSGVAEARVGIALIPWLHELEARLDRLEGAQK